MRRECLNWQQLLNEALTAEGSVTDIYSLAFTSTP
jgi:hypothetical protein